VKPRRLAPRFFQISLLVIVVFSFTSSLFVLNGKASPASTYYYRFNVGREGFTNVQINFNSTDALGDSWVFVPRFSNWNYSVTRGTITQSSIVETDQVISQSLYFYQAFRFRYQSSGTFNMTVRFDHDSAALIIEPRGIFYSPQIGFEPSSSSRAEVLFYSSFIVKSNLAVVVGANGNYPAAMVQPNRVLFNLPENIVRLQVEFSTQQTTPSYTTLMSSDNKTFTFKSVTRYQTYARSVLNFYDRIYSANLTRLFNVTLDSVAVQWFLPDFQSLLTVGGFVPVFTGEQLGEININVAFIRAVNGTIEVIAAHELVHRFLGRTGLSPNDFLWLHEGMAQYISVNLVSDLGYDGGKSEKGNLENGATRLIQNLGGENFGSLSLQDWSPSYQPSNVDISWLYVASYYAVSRLPEIVDRQGYDYYSRFFKLINGAKVDNINVLALYLSTAANASVAITLKNRWGFDLVDLYNSPVSDLLKEAGKTIESVNPVFQPYRFFAEYLYRQALISAEQGDYPRAQSLLQLAISLANLAPLLTFLTILVILALLAYFLSRRARRPKPPTTVPPPPPEILQPPA